MPGTAALVGSAGAVASRHHPGSHAVRQGDGRVRVEAVALRRRTLCSTIAEIRPGPPPVNRRAGRQRGRHGRLRRDGRGLRRRGLAARAEAILALPTGAGQVLIYIMAPDGSLAASERVPIR